MSHLRHCTSGWEEEGGAGVKKNIGPPSRFSHENEIGRETRSWVLSRYWGGY